MERIRQLIVTHLWWLVLLTALVMLVCHGLGVRRVVVDNTSLILLALVLISPFVAAIKRIKIGEFEAEIQPDEVARLAQQAKKSLSSEPSVRPLPPETSEASAAIRDLAETDPVVALAKLRIEVESRLRRLDRRPNLSGADQGRSAPLTQVIRELVSRQVLWPEFGTSLRDVISICNRAVHGEDIRDVDARRIINTGTELLEVLDRTVRDYASAHPTETTVITAKERDELAAARYRLTTIVPYVDKPERRMYLLTQEELDAFLDGYSEFAEFVVGLERIE
jgi:hypothetical protein